MNILILLIAELFLGAIVGFLLSDNRKGLSIEDIKISSILFLIATALVFWENPTMDGTMYAHLAFSWLVLVVGVILGEMVKLRIIKKIISSINKKDIQIAVNELVRLSSEVQYMRRKEDIASLHQKLYEVQNMLNILSKKSKKTQPKEFNQKLYYLFELCEKYVSLSVQLREDSAKGKDVGCTNEEWLLIGRELTSLSWDTLNHAEENVKKELGKAFSVQAVKQAISHKA